MRLPRGSLLLSPLIIGACAIAWGAADRLRAPRPGAAGSPLPHLAPAPGAVRGTVCEVLRAGPYSYHRVAPLGDADGGGCQDARAARPLGERWVVSLGPGAPVGARVGGRLLGERRDFPSRRLGRSFPLLLFAQLRVDPAPPAPAAASVP